MRRLSMIVLLAALCGAGRAGVDGWLTDFEAAKRQAGESKRPILANFSGSDWCGWCIRLDKEVFSQESWMAFAREHLVLFVADFPRGKELPATLKTQNDDLLKTYGVEGFPTVLLLDASGKVMARTGYRRGGADAYVRHVRDLLKLPAPAAGGQPVTPNP